METQSLKENWQLIASDIKKNSIVNNEDIFSFSLPGEIHHTLFNLGKIEDPRVEDNAGKCTWIDKSKWKVSTIFEELSKKDERVILKLSRIKAKASVAINGEEVGYIDNEYKIHYFDITEFVNKGENKLELELEALTCNDKNTIEQIGIFSPIEIIITNSFFLRDFSIVPVKRGANWEVEVKTEIESFSESEGTITLEVANKKEDIKIALKQGIGLYSTKISIPEDSVELWWPNGYGKPHIYPMKISLGDFNIERMIAFRTIELKKSQNLAISINGKPIFMKGANWQGMEILSDGTLSQRERRLLESASLANMNMLRVSKHVGYEHYGFYDECDRLGIAIWQALPDNPEEEEYTLLEIKSHPSIVLWTVEGEDAEKIARREMEIDPSRPVYIERKENKCWPIWQSGEGFESYHKKSPDFISEFGFPSFPSKETLAYISKDKLNLTSYNMEYHQQQKNDIETIFALIARNFNFPLDIEKIEYLSQVQQAWAMTSALMGWRAFMPYTMGTLYSSLNDRWPMVSNSSIDYSGKWKVAHYAARRLFSNLTPLIYLDKDKLLVYVVNDTAKDEEVELKLKFRYFNGKKKESHVYNVSVPSMTSVKVREVDLKKLDRENLFAYAKMQNKNIIRERTSLLTSPKLAKLEKADIKTEIIKLGSRKASIKISSSKPAFWVTLDSGSIEGTFSDNFMAIRQTAEKSIIFDSAEELDIEKLKQELSVMDLYSAMH